MDNLGAIIGPLLGIPLVALVGVRGAILLSVIPGLLAVAAIVYAILAAKLPKVGHHQPIKAVTVAGKPRIRTGFPNSAAILHQFRPLPRSCCDRCVATGRCP